MKNPPHPGSFIRGEIIEGRGLSVSQAAEALRVLRPTLSAMLNGRAALSPEMALRIEKAFGLSLDTLMRMQCNYDIAQVRARADEIDVQPFVPKAPRLAVRPSRPRQGRAGRRSGASCR